MPLQADITVKLDAGALIQTLLTKIAAPAAGLDTLDVPVDAGQLSGAGSVGFDSAAILSSVSTVVGQVAPRLAALSPAGDVFAQITTTLQSIEQLTTRDITSDFSTLAERLTAELESGTEGGFVGILLRLTESLSSAPESALLKSLLQTVLGLLGGGGIQTPSALGTTIPAVIDAVRVLGGLMTLESVLGESERLTRIASEQLDAARARELIDQLTAALTPALAQVIAATDPTDPDAVDVAIAAAARAANLLDEVEAYIAKGMGFGEATLAYLDVNQVQVEIDIAKALLRGTDLSPLEQMLRSAISGLKPVLNLDFAAAPRQALDTLLTTVEAQIGQFAAKITAFDPLVIAGPLVDGLGQVTGVIKQFSALVARIVQDIRAAMEKVRQVVAGLPLDDIATTIQRVLAPVQQALDAIRDLVAQIKAALETAANAAIAALGQVEGAVDEFKSQIEALFGEARKFIDGLHLDQIAGQIADKIKEFNALLAKADMKPYFDTAASAIDSAADVIEKVPFGLLPESMKADVDAAVAPVRETDAAAVEAEIEALLGISGGKFELRPQLDAAIAGIQKKFQDLIAALEALDPKQHLATLDQQFQTLAARIKAISPQLGLEPVREAIDKVKKLIGGFDLQKALAPVAGVFEKVTAALQEYDPAKLILPIEKRVNDARGKLTAAIRLDDWAPAIDEISKRALALLDLIDPAQLKPLLDRLFAEIETLIQRMPDVNPAAWLGGLVADLLRGIGARIYPDSFNAILRWINGGPAANDLAARSARIGDALANTKAAVDAVNPSTLSAPLAAAAAAVRAAVASLAASLAAASSQRVRLETAGARLNLEERFSALAANRSRYLTVLANSASLAENLRRTGLSEAGTAVAALRSAVSPIGDVTGIFQRLLEHMGITGFEHGLRGVLQNVFSVIPAARFAGLLTPIFAAIRGRLTTLLDAILNPVKDGIAQIKTLIGQIDLGPVRQSLESVFQEVLAQINALNPLQILKDPLDAFAKLKKDVVDFDPLSAILNVLDTLRDTVARVLQKLSAQKLLATPVAIYTTILQDVKKLDVPKLIEPVFDQLDAIAKQVTDGLDDTVTAFVHLQQALPAGGGDSSVTVEVV